MKIGACLSFDNGLIGVVKEAVNIGANACMFYTGSPTSTYKRPVQSMKIQSAFDYMKQNKLNKNNLVIHSNYISNFAAPEEKKRLLAKTALAQEIEIADYIEVPYLVCHIGNYTSSTLQEGIDNVIESFNDVINSIDEFNVKILLENSAGQGTAVGSNINEIAEIIDGTDNPDLFGLCFDTQHAFAAGYDIVGNLDDVLSEIDDKIGLNKLAVCHINGSQKKLNSHVDRHANIGVDDYIGAEALYNFVHHPYLIDKIHILETPIEKNGTNRFATEINFLKNETFDEWLLI